VYHGLIGRRDLAHTKRADGVLVSSAYMADAVRRVYGVEPRTSPLAVDTDRFRPLGLERRHMILSVGSLTPLKAMDFVVRAMAQYPASTRPLLVIVSNFETHAERAYVEALARDLAVDVQFLSNVSDEQLAGLYNAAKAVAYAPIREPFGLVPLEAMACGTPVVAVREGGIAETVVDGETGTLVVRDERRFAEALQRVVTDRGWALERGRRGRDHVLSQWTWDRAIDRLEGHLRAIA
jgi:glycosyltransferase involved in cell wall biosynthesis